MKDRRFTGCCCCLKQAKRRDTARIHCHGELRGVIKRSRCLTRSEFYDNLKKYVFREFCCDPHNHKARYTGLSVILFCNKLLSPSVAQQH